MPHGLPDDANIVKAQWAYNLDDMAELAVRTGGSKLLDRLGDVVYAQTFDRGVKNLGNDGFGAGNYQSLTGLSSIQGGVSYKLFAPAGVGNYARCWVTIYKPLSSQTGYEYAFTVGENVEAFQFFIDDYRDASRCRYEIRWSRIAGGWSVWNDPGVFVLIHAQADLFLTGYTWWRFKLVVDLDTPRYRYLKLNDEILDLSAYVPATFVPGPQVYQEIFWVVYPNALDDSLVMLDDIHITQTNL